MRVWIQLPANADSLLVAGTPLTATWGARIAEAGLQAAGAPDEAGVVAVVDGRCAALPAALLAGAVHDHVRLTREGDDEPVIAPVAPRGARVLAVDDPAGLRIDAPGGRAAADHRARTDHLRALVAAGVHVVDPARTLVDPTVAVAPGAVLWPEVVLRGRTRVGAGAEIRPGCWIEDTVIEEGAMILPHCVCTGALVGAGSHVGPMAHLRPGAVLVGDNKVGNFVEVKQAELGRGAKASHLTYLGDATVGAEANIGAGTITCNYDGFRKHRTIIGAGAFIGSNTALVAPIRVGDGAIVGAGSVITRDVPDDALGVERAEQRNHEGLARRLNDRNRRRREDERRGGG